MPIVDIMLILLVVFMVTAPNLKNKLDIILPNTDNALVNNDLLDNTIKLSISKNGSVLINDQKITRTALIYELQRLKNDNQDLKVLIYGDKSLNYGTIIQLLDRIHGIGCNNISLITDGYN